jgi:uncharacterized protein (DUF779 family)
MTALPGPQPAFRLSATDAARRAVARLRDEQSGPVVLVQSGCWCALSVPMCFPEGQFMVRDVDVLIGDVDGCPIFIDQRLLQAWHPTCLELDVTPGVPEGFSLPAGPGLIFVTRHRSTEQRTLACRSPNPPATTLAADAERSA